MNLKTEVTRKQSTPNFPENEHFLPPYTYTYLHVSGSKKCLFFGKLGVLCFLVTSILRFSCDMEWVNLIFGDSRTSYPDCIYLFNINKGKIRTIWEICPKFTMKTPEWRHWRRSGVFIVNFEQISQCFGVPVVDFDQVNIGWLAFCNAFCRHSSERTKGIGSEVAYFGSSQII